MKYIQWIAAAGLAAGVLIWPETAVNAGREAMYNWYMSVAPALFPFMALMPVLTGRQTTEFYERIFRRILPAALRLPGSAAPAIAIAMTAGSPAGAMAIMRTASAAGWKRSTADRLSACLCGVSPAFLIGSVGVVMMNSRAAGMLLLRTQLLSQGIMLLATRFWREEGETIAPIAGQVEEKPIRNAVGSVLVVCGYMVLFQVIAALLARLTGRSMMKTIALCLLDLPSGAREVASYSLSYYDKCTILAFLTGFGGICIAVQNLSVGIKPGIYAAGRVSNALLNVFLVRIQQRLNVSNRGFSPDPMLISSFIACVFSLIGLISFENTSFLNKRKLERKRSKMA